MHRIAPTLLAVLLASSSLWAEAPTGERPNVLVILADDQGWGDLRVNGNLNLETPNIDGLARDGALFERFYVCPVCSPTRAQFLTGRYHPRLGVHDVSRGGERLNLDERTIADAFKAAGYKTGAFGKWHNGTQYPYHPNGRGFEEFYGFCSGHWGDYFSPPLDHNGEIVQGNGYLADDLTDHAMAFMEERRAGPFFCYLAFNTPHSPMQVPDRFWGKFKNADLKMRYVGAEKEELDHTRAALAMCENIDWNVGRALAKLDELGLARKTIVVYFSDNGPNGWRWSGGMKGRKGSTDEGGVRAPLLVRWPEHVKPGTRVGQVAGDIDLFPTLADLAGAPVGATKPLDGVSLAPLLLGKPISGGPERMIFSTWDGKVSARTGRFRLDAAGALFDMPADPGQTVDLAGKNPDVAASMAAAVAAWRREVMPSGRKDDRPFPVGYREFRATHLPARDGVPHGGVRRSGRAPNSSYFTNWKTPEDSMTWDIEVATAGRYEAVVYYACPASSVGSRIELEFRGASVAGRVAEANDVPARGAEHDRSPRDSESYVKDFKPLKLGEVNLPAGRGALTMRAPEIPGAEVVDMRAITLRLLD